jgi:hypothetical protein
MKHIIAVLFVLLFTVMPLSASGGGNLYLVQQPSAPEKLVWTNTAGEWRSEISSYGDAGAENMLVDVNTSVLAANGQYRLNVRSGNDENTTFDVQTPAEGEGYVAVSGSTFKGLTIGRVGAPELSDGIGLDIHGKLLRLRESKTPASASANCNKGEIGWDTNYIYVCVNNNTWKRSGLTTW